MKKSLVSVLYSAIAIIAVSFVLSISGTSSADAAVQCIKSYTSCKNGCPPSSGVCPSSCCTPTSASCSSQLGSGWSGTANYTCSGASGSWSYSSCYKSCTVSISGGYLSGTQYYGGSCSTSGSPTCYSGYCVSGSSCLTSYSSQSLSCSGQYPYTSGSGWRSGWCGGYSDDYSDCYCSFSNSASVPNGYTNSTCTAAAYNSCSGSNTKGSGGSCSCSVSVSASYCGKGYYRASSTSCPACPAYDGQYTGTKPSATTSGCTSGGIGECTVTCPNIYDTGCVGNTISPDQTSVNYNSSKTPKYQCTWTITAKDGYHASGSGTASAACPANQYKFNFNGNGTSSVAMSQWTYTFDATTNMPANTYVRTGYDFTGWAETATSIGTDNSGDVVLASYSPNYATAAQVRAYIVAKGDVADADHNKTYNLYATWNKCSPGYYWTGSACTSCPRGTYKSAQSDSFGDAQQCTICPNGTTTASTASTSSSACSVTCASQVTGGPSVAVWETPTWDDLKALGTTTNMAVQCPVVDCNNGWKKNSNSCLQCATSPGNPMYVLNTCEVDYCGDDGYRITSKSWPTNDEVCVICPVNEWWAEAYPPSTPDGNNSTTVCKTYCEAGWWHASGSQDYLTQITETEKLQGKCSIGTDCSYQTCNNWNFKEDGHTIIGAEHCNSETCIIDRCKVGYHFEGTGTDTKCVPNTYTITLNKSGSTGTMVESIECTFDSKNCVLPANSVLVKEGHTNKTDWCKNISYKTDASFDGDTGDRVATATGCYDAGTTETSNISPNGTDITLYAYFTENQYVITHVPNNGMNVGDVAGTLTTYLRYNVGFSLTNGSKYSARPSITVPTRRGYTLMGYRTEDNCGGDLIIAPNGKFEADKKTFTDENTTLYACWEANVYKYTLEDNGGNVGTIIVYVKYDTGWSHNPDGPFTDRITIIPPTRTNYKFTGYYDNWNLPGQTLIIGTDGNITGMLDYTDRDLTLLAGWDYRDYTVSFDNNGGADGTDMSSIECTYTKPCTLPANTFKKDGYIFGGWASSAANANAGTVAHVDRETFDFFDGMDVTYYAIWYYNARFAANGGSGSASPITQKCYHNNYCYMADQGTLSKTAYTFDGWSTANDGSGIVVGAWDAVPSDTYDSYLTSGGYLDLYARWKHTVIFDGNGQSTAATSVPAKMDCYLNASCILPDAGEMAKTGYAFDGWNRASNGSGANYGVGTTYNHTGDTSATNTLYARWKYRLVYDGNQAKTGSVPPALDLYYGQSTVTPDNIGNLARGGRIFDGWDRLPEPMDTSTSVPVGTTISNVPEMSNAQITDGSTVTLYVKWFGCDPGYWNDGTDKICHPSGPGRYTTDCDDEGHFCTSTELCPSGTFAPGNANPECQKSTEGNHTTDCIDTINWLGCKDQTKCEVGTYSDEKGMAKVCKDPGPGNHTDGCDGAGMGCTTKNMCESGTYTNETNADRVCTASDPGNHTSNCLDTVNWLGCIEQTKCEPGTYSDVQGMAKVCKDTGPGYHTDGACDENGYGCTTKGMCESGTYSNNAQQDRTCPQSNTGNHTSNCLDTINWLGCTEQVHCETGTYSDVLGMAQTCKTSDNGNHTSNCLDSINWLGCQSQTLCEPGTYSDVPGMAKVCKDTGPGHHTDGACNADGYGCTTKTMCESGTYSNNAQQDRTCPQSEQGNHTAECLDTVNWLGCTIQTPCEPGTYSDVMGMAQFCKDSESGYHTGGACDENGYGCTKRDMCEYGTYSNDGQRDRSCTPSSAGNHTTTCLDEANWVGCKSQTLCEPGTYSMTTGAGKYCTNTGPGYHTSENCDTDGYGCTARKMCESGTYSNNEQQDRSCPESTVGNHTTNCEDTVNWLGCKGETKCEPGTYSDTTGMAKFCKDSGAGYHTDGACDVDGYGCTTREMCETGTYSVNNKTDRVCTTADAGNHTDNCVDTTNWLGCREQSLCTPGTYAPTAGTARECLNSEPGYHTSGGCDASGYGCTDREMCEYGTWSNSHQRDRTCQDADAGHHTTNCIDEVDWIGCRAQDGCPAGTYSSGTGAGTTCVAVPEGGYNEGEGNTDYNVCAEGAYNIGTGNYDDTFTGGSSIGCVPCPAGTTTNGGGAKNPALHAGAAACNQKCDVYGMTNLDDIASYNETWWDVTTNTVHSINGVDLKAGICTVKTCVAGSFRESDTECTACAPGSFTAVENYSSSCALCAKGSYNNASHSTSCTSCMENAADWAGTFGSTTTGAGATSCNADCGNVIPSLKTQPGGIIDSTIVNEWVQTIWSNDGSTAAASTNTLTNDCVIVDCRAGAYYDAGECWLCNTGSYSASTGSDACIPCQSTPGNWGLTTSGPGQTSCNATCGKENVESWLDTLWEDLGLNNGVPNVCGIEQCTAGHYYSGGANGSGNCDGECAAGYYCPPGSTDEKGTTDNPNCDTNMDDCPPYTGEHKCKPGWVSGAGAWYCEQCPVGSVSSPDTIPGGYSVVPKTEHIGGFADITGTITQTPGTSPIPSASNTQCWYCGPGLIPNGDHSACEKCPSGSFKPSGDETVESCTVCPPNSNCLEPGLEEPVCLPGYVLERDNYGKYTCESIEVPCTIGEFGYGTQDRQGNCVLVGCLGDNHISPDGTRCEPNVVTCETTGGSGFREWDSINQTYGECIETECRVGYQNVGATCVPCAREHALTYLAGAGCIIDKCETDYHPNPTGTSCELNMIECEIPHATSAVRYWENNQYGVCTALACETGYHVASNACVADDQSCTIENGTGVQTWLGTSTDGGWSECMVVSCNAGYTSDPTETNEPSKACGPCRNRYGLHGEIAVSSYAGGCEIAACMYQGEVYNLENNECVPLCDIHGHSDESGSVVWDPNAHKCIRTCNEGYSMW